MGFANLAATPESLHEFMPLQDDRQGILFTAAARLDNRDELCDVFGISASEREKRPDGLLAFYAYRKWGEGTPVRLFGDWAFAAWDSRKRTLFLARDQLGNVGLYYYYLPPFFAFSSDPEGLFALSDIERKIDEKHIASYLAIFSMGNEDGTCWMNIRRLISGCSLSVTPDGLREKQYWELKEVPAVVYGTDDEYVAGFLDHYRAAVKARLRSRHPVGTTLSAGLDSGSVTVLAAQDLKEQGQTLTAFTSTPLFPADHLVPGALADEWPLARAVSLRYNNIVHIPVSAVAVTPLAGVERAVKIAHSPQHAAANEFWIMAVHDAARGRSIGVMLTGQLGNGGVSWSGGQDRIFWLFATGKWDEGMKALTKWKRRNGRSWIRTIAERLIKPLLRPYWKRGQGLLKATVPPWGDYAAIHPAFAARIGLLNAMKAAGHDATFNRVIDPFEERRLTILRNGTMVGPIWHVMGAAFGLEVRDPTADIRLLEYCLSVPGEQDTLGGGERMLIRRAMEGLLPTEVQWNKIRGRQAADVALRLLRHPEEMEAVLSRLAVHREAPQYLDLDLMRRVWQDLQTEVNVRTSQQAATILLRGVMCGYFIEDAGRLSSR